MKNTSQNLQIAKNTFLRQKDKNFISPIVVTVKKTNQKYVFKKNFFVTTTLFHLL